MAELTELEYAEKRMQQKWYDLVLAEQQGLSVQTLERLYTSYVLAVEVYNRSLQEQQEQNAPVVVLPTQTSKKKAS